MQGVNRELYQLHRSLFFIYMSFILLGMLLSIFAVSAPAAANHSVNYVEAVEFFCLLPAIPCALHFLAASWVKAGKKKGRTLSKIIAWLMVFIFPVGTAISIYLFKKTGMQWQHR